MGRRSGLGRRLRFYKTNWLRAAAEFPDGSAQRARAALAVLQNELAPRGGGVSQYIQLSNSAWGSPHPRT
jgi:hypothetical protein